MELYLTLFFGFEISSDGLRGGIFFSTQASAEGFIYISLREREFLHEEETPGLYSEKIKRRQSVDEAEVTDPWYSWVSWLWSVVTLASEGS